MTLLFVVTFITVLIAGMQVNMAEVDTEVKMDDKEKEKQKRIDQIRKQIHPHDDEPDPTAYIWETITFLRCFLLFVLDLRPCLFYLSKR